MPPKNDMGNGSDFIANLMLKEVEARKLLERSKDYIIESLGNDDPTPVIVRDIDAFLNG